jgi:hypothetical protein
MGNRFLQIPYVTVKTIYRWQTRGQFLSSAALAPVTRSHCGCDVYVVSLQMPYVLSLPGTDLNPRKLSLHFEQAGLIVDGDVPYAQVALRNPRSTPARRYFFLRNFGEAVEIDGFFSEFEVEFNFAFRNRDALYRLHLTDSVGGRPPVHHALCFRVL